MPNGYLMIYLYENLIAISFYSSEYYAYNMYFIIDSVIILIKNAIKLFEEGSDAKNSQLYLED